jgi:hypothetical protein
MTMEDGFPPEFTLNLIGGGNDKEEEYERREFGCF